MGENQKKVQEQVAKLKSENAANEQAQEETKALAKSQLEQIADNSELAQMYGDNAKVGSENLAGELPLLKVHAVGKSSSNELQDGSEPEDGNFFYKPTQEQFDEIECHILTVSKGFRAEGIEQGKAPIFNQVIAGILIDNGEYKPFFMYFTGLKLSKLWDFGKEANKYTHAKPFPIPMFALKVKLTTEKISNTFGKSWIVNFQIIRSEDKTPVLVTDAGLFQFLKDSVGSAQETISQIIVSKTIKESEAESLDRSGNSIVEGQEFPPVDVG